MNRRLFIKRLTLAAAGGLTLCNSNAFALAADRRRLSRIGMQLYTVRRELEKDFEGTLAQVAALGYGEVEFAGYFGRKPLEVKRFSSVSGSTRRPRTCSSRSCAATCDRCSTRRTPSATSTCSSRGSRTRNAGRSTTTAASPTSSRRPARECNARASSSPTTITTSSSRLWRGRFPTTSCSNARTRASSDSKWICTGRSRAARSPVAYFERYPGRFHLLHVKDMDSTPRRFFADVGKGVIDFKSIFARSREAGVRHYFVENDEPAGSPFESLRVSFDYLKRLEF